MTTKATELRIDGLTALQVVELRTALEATGADCLKTLDDPKLEGGKVGEPALLSVVITIAPYVIAAVAGWIAKAKKRATTTITYTKRDPNGGMESFRIEKSCYEEGESPSAGIEAFLEKKLGASAAPTS